MIIECGKGHLYDSDVHTVCPYCNRDGKGNAAGEVSVTAVSKTAPVAPERQAQEVDTHGGQSVIAANKTLPPKGYGQGEHMETDPHGGRSVTETCKTLPPKDYAVKKEKQVEDAGKTVSILQENLGMDPVVGWVVCIQGKTKGTGFQLKGRINTIGRNSDSDICIKDDTISAESHAQIGYSARNNRFTLIPDKNKNYIYLNDQEVFTPMDLNPFDVIDLGETKLIFVPLCGDRFRWESTGKEDEAIS